MSKSLTANAQTSIDQKLGSEPIILIKVDWINSGTRYYSTKDLTVGTINAEGRILNLGSLNNTMKDNNVGTLGTMRFLLDDVDNSLKTIFDSEQLIHTPVTVYQHYEGNDEADLFILFSGVLIDPIVWSEGERTLEINCETYINDNDFSTFLSGQADREFFSIFNQEAFGKPWPVSFGSPVHVPAVKIKRTAQSKLTGTFVSNASGFDTSFVVDSANEFPQNVQCTVEIGGIIFSGKFSGTTFTLTGGDVNIGSYTSPVGGNFPRYGNVSISIQPDANYAVIDSFVPLLDCWVRIESAGFERHAYVIEQNGTTIRFAEPVNYLFDSDGTRMYGVGAANIREAARRPVLGWLFREEYKDSNTLIENRYVARNFWSFSAGATVRLWAVTEGFSFGNYETRINYYGTEYYVNNLNQYNYDPSEKFVINTYTSSGGVVSVKAVYAERNGELVQIPSQYYSVLTNDFINLTEITSGESGSIRFASIVFDRPLWQYDEGWGNQIYVTMVTSTGSNTVDALELLLDNYSNLTVDATSFAATKTAISSFPSNFALLNPGNVLSVCEDIAWQARCALLISEGVIKLKYLGAEPSASIVTDFSDIEYKSLSLTVKSREDVITQIKGKWRKNYYDSPEVFIQQLNVDKYGIETLSRDFNIYNSIGLVAISLNFWLRRMAKLWRRLKFNHFLNSLQLDLFDVIDLQLTDTSLLNSASIKGVVQELNYNIADGTTSMLVELPAEAGTTDVDDNYWTSIYSSILVTDPSLFMSPISYWLTSVSDVKIQKVKKTQTSKQAKVVRALELTDPAELLAAGDHLVDIFADGFDAPATEKAVPIQSNKPLVENQEIEVKVREQVTSTVEPQLFTTVAEPMPFAATVESEVGGGAYFMTRTYGEGPSGTFEASELNGSTGIGSGTVVIVHNFDGNYRFFFPIEDCS